MLKILAIAITTILTSFYYFPVCFAALPAVNTKQIMAIVGVIAWGTQLSMKRSANLGKELFPLSVYAIIFSLICFFSVTYNSTTDYSYATYIASMWLWLAGAYGVCRIIRMTHGSVSFRTVSHYLIAVCVIQCILAMVIDYNPAFKAFVDTYIMQSQEFLTRVKRIYGIGAMLDPAGIRFSVVLILLSYLIASRKAGEKIWLTLLYFSAFAIITVIGNIIARTTIAGDIMGLIYIIYRQIYGGENRPFDTREIVIASLVTICVFVPVVVYFYNTNVVFHKHLRFGFEGFFSLVEKGRWDVSSNEVLKSMVVLPDNAKTWLIGDGYFDNPKRTDPYFTGKIISGYYMGTDIGYLRFIFYCGTIGLLAFSAYICKCMSICIGRFPEKKMLMLFLGLLNFVVWFKVSTDIFLIFALLLLIDPENTSDEDKSMLPTSELSGNMPRKSNMPDKGKYVY